ERDDLVELLADVRPPQTQDRAVQEHVLASGEVRMEARPELEQRADAPADVRATGCRLDDRREDAQQRALPGAVAADQADGAPRPDGEGDVAERPDLGRPASPAREHEALERARVARVHAEPARDAVDADLASARLGHEATPAPSADVTRSASPPTNSGSA